MSRLADVAGTQEPIYGPSAIKSVAQEAQTTPYTEITRDDLKWMAKDSTCVESQVFYLLSDSGDIAMAQVIYSNVAYGRSLCLSSCLSLSLARCPAVKRPADLTCPCAHRSGIRITCQFNTKIFSRDPSKPHLWCSNPLRNYDFSEDKTSFYADDCAVELSEDGNSYTIKSMTDERATVNLKITKAAPGFQVGETGTTLYGTDLENPWGSMRHAFWPRCVSEGTITTTDGAVDFKGQAIFIYALQGMKPHHAAATWNFANFQGPRYSACLMEFTTPPSYGTTVVDVGGVARDGEIITAGANTSVTHTKSTNDPSTDWAEPTEAKYQWSGKTQDGKDVEAVIETPLGTRADRVDVMAHVPGFVKKIVSGAAGTKPYIYQVRCSSRAPVCLDAGRRTAMVLTQLLS